MDLDLTASTHSPDATALTVESDVSGVEIEIELPSSKRALQKFLESPEAICSKSTETTDGGGQRAKADQN